MFTTLDFGPLGDIEHDSGGWSFTTPVRYLDPKVSKGVVSSHRGPLTLKTRVGTRVGIPNHALVRETEKKKKNSTQGPIEGSSSSWGVLFGDPRGLPGALPNPTFPHRKSELEVRGPPGSQWGGARREVEGSRESPSGSWCPEARRATPPRYRPRRPVGRFVALRVDPLCRTLVLVLPPSLTPSPRPTLESDRGNPVLGDG